ncbi:MAG TPA: hypothetical protein VEU30_06400, partial [Thermoanaerobaculia bacterium]|nr:hypothetical protein [Thermoanaerobaculia bacterium]
MLRPLFFFLLVLALIGDARIFLFVMNRLVFGSHREEKSPWHFLLYAIPPVLLFLTLLFWPLHAWIGALADNRIVEKFTPDRMESVPWSLWGAKAGSAWLFLAAAVGAYWIVDRVRTML